MVEFCSVLFESESDLVEYGSELSQVLFSTNQVRSSPNCLIGFRLDSSMMELIKDQFRMVDKKIRTFENKDYPFQIFFLVEMLTNKLQK